MSKIIFNEHQRRQIEANPYVVSVSDRSIQYTVDFKLKAVQDNLKGKGTSEIFKAAGFDIEIIGLSKIQSAIHRWKKIYQIHGEKGFTEERRGKGSTGRPPMSRRGNCLDNAPMESFFGHFKDEVDYKEAESLADLHTLVLEYMNHYNHIRKQWTLKKMTPASYRSHLIAA